jgi:substrate import-associated zinc metallohydrolase lipoprotein
MKQVKIFLLFFAGMLLTACGTDNDVKSESIFDTTAPSRTGFDLWLYNNYTKPYNIMFNYRYIDSETDQTYNLIPADEDKAKALAIMVKHVWLDAYAEAVGADFIKKYAPRVYQLIGSPEYNSNGSIVLGVAEGGMKITLFRVNAIDIDHPVIDHVSSFPDTEAVPIDLNYWFFHTMHHEFCHILTQTKNYSTDFQTISAADYRTVDWVNVDDKDAPKYGFPSGYATKEYNEDFAELYSIYVTHTPEAWQGILNASLIVTGSKVKTDAKGNPIFKLDADGNRIPKGYLLDQDGNRLIQMGEDGKLYYALEYEVETEDTYDYTYYNNLVAKMNLIKDYFKNSWGIDLDKLRDVVLRRSAEVSTLDLRTLK